MAGGVVGGASQWELGTGPLKLQGERWRKGRFGDLRAAHAEDRGWDAGALYLAYSEFAGASRGTETELVARIRRAGHASASGIAVIETCIKKRKN